MKFLMLLILFALTAVAQQSVTTEEAERASRKISLLVLNHPEALVRQELTHLIKDGKVQFALNNMFPEMNSSLEKINGRERVILWYNPEFVLKLPDVPNLADKDTLLKLAIFHEAVHISDHFDGRLLLLPLRPDKPIPLPVLARRIWDMEWSAVNREWALAKKWNKGYLVPIIRKATSTSETPRTLLRGFYELQMNGGAVVYYPALAQEFTAIYKKELNKLPVVFR